MTEVSTGTATAGSGQAHQYVIIGAGPAASS